MCFVFDGLNGEGFDEVVVEIDKLVMMDEVVWCWWGSEEVVP